MVAFSTWKRTLSTEQILNTYTQWTLITYLLFRRWTYIAFQQQVPDITIHMRKNDGLENYLKKKKKKKNFFCIFTSGRFCLTRRSVGVRLHFWEAPGWSGRVHMYAKPTKWLVCPAKTQISLGIRPVWSVSLLSAWRKLGSLVTDWAQSEDSDQTESSLGAVIFLVLSWGGSNYTEYSVYFLQQRHWLPVMACRQANLSCISDLYDYQITILTTLFVLWHFTDHFQEWLECKWATSRENLSSGFPTRWDSNQAAQLQKLAESWNFGFSKYRYYTI